MKPPRSRSTSAPAHKDAGSVRIVGGHWRGSKLPVLDAAGLRPTSDRVRETLFNWLMPVLPGARVLDAYAGSGALGLEAVSRGAASAVLVEREPRVAQLLRQTAARLDRNGQVQVVNDDVLRWLGGGVVSDQSRPDQSRPDQSRPDQCRFDLVFLDPPFAAGVWEAAVAAITPHLSAQAWVYVESPLAEAPAVAAHWRMHRQGQTRDVRYALYQLAPVASGQCADTLRGDSPQPDSA